MKVYPKHPSLLSEGVLKSDKVINHDGEELGKIEDFLIDTKAGKVVYAILSFGDALGMGNKLYALPWDAMDLNTDKHALVLNVDKDKLKDAPGFDRDTWSDMSSLDWDNRAHEFYGQQPYWVEERPAGERLAETKKRSGAIMETTSNTRPIAPSFTVQASGLVKASALKGEKVKNRANENLGKIEEIMIKLDDGSIGYLVLSFGGFLGMGNKLFAVPWHAMAFDSGKHEYILDIPKSELKNAPSFDKNNWPDTENPDWDKEVQGFYGKTRPEKA